MQTNIRDLKARLSEVIRGVERGETVTVSVHNHPVARIIPVGRRLTLRDLAEAPGVRWNGGKPKGLARAEAMPAGVLLSDWVAEDRR
ncbi:MAG: type II toxin-antitoxin system prevent-host-death family antitoxin [Betaproteobacteria bacterium]|nr:type II toxin-antitoxin system prevent-host-death family antitoxin [Betaproteobacteria bacterium]